MLYKFILKEMNKKLTEKEKNKILKEKIKNIPLEDMMKIVNNKGNEITEETNKILQYLRENITEDMIKIVNNKGNEITEENNKILKEIHKNITEKMNQNLQNIDKGIADPDIYKKISEDMMNELKKFKEEKTEFKKTFDTTFDITKQIIEKYFDKFNLIKDNINLIKDNNITDKQKSILVETFNLINGEDNFNNNNKYCNDAIEQCKVMFTPEQLEDTNLITESLWPFCYCLADIHFYFEGIKTQYYSHEKFRTSVYEQSGKYASDQYTSGEDDKQVKSSCNNTRQSTPMHYYNKRAIQRTANLTGKNRKTVANPIADYDNGKYKAMYSMIQNIIAHIYDNQYKNSRFANAKHTRYNPNKTNVLSGEVAVKIFEKMNKMFTELKGQKQVGLSDKRSIFISPSGYGAFPIVASVRFPSSVIVATDRNPDAVEGLGNFFQANDPNHERNLYRSDVTEGGIPDDMKGQFDFFVSCPPYFGIEYYPDQNGSYKTDQELLKDYQKWKDDLLTKFIEQATGSLSHDGIGCFILPTTDFQGNNAVMDAEGLLEKKGYTIIYLK